LKTRAGAASLKNAVKNRFFWPLVGDGVDSGGTVAFQRPGKESRAPGFTARRFRLKAFCATSPSGVAPLHDERVE
jgi:hypothetical protein